MSVAHLVGNRSPKPGVAGSSPARHAKYKEEQMLIGILSIYQLPAIKEVGHEGLKGKRSILRICNRVNTKNPGHVLTRNGFRKVA